MVKLSEHLGTKSVKFFIKYVIIFISVLVDKFFVNIMLRLNQNIKYLNVVQYLKLRTSIKKILYF